MQPPLQRKLPIGALLRQAGLLTSEQLAQGLAVQKTRRPVVPLGQLCIELGFLSVTELGRVLSPRTAVHPGTQEKAWGTAD
jgi:hypothetical protein